MKGYKAFDRWLKSRQVFPFQFKVGETYTETGRIKMCRRGFHFCSLLTDVFTYYPIRAGTRVCEVEADDKCQIFQDGCGKSVCRRITIIRELTRREILEVLRKELDTVMYGKTGIWTGHTIRLLEKAYAEADKRRGMRMKKTGGTECSTS